MTHPLPVSIRPAEPADLPSLAGLLAELFALEADFTADSARQLRGLELLLEAGERSCLLVADTPEGVVGMVSVQVLISTAEGGPVGLLEDLVVRKDWRGRGAGTALLVAAESWAGDRGLLRLQLLADRDNAAALSFYRGRLWGPTQLVCLRRAK